MTKIPETLDHVVYAAPDLRAAVDAFTTLTGVEPAPGGAHPRGTANALVAFTVAGARVRQYLEIIGPDPQRSGDEPISTFGIEDLTAPRVVTFAVAPPNLEEAVDAARAGGHDPGSISPLSRRTPDGTELAWRLSRTEGHTQPLVPFLIDWGETAHPGLSDIPTIELTSLSGESPDAPAARDLLRLLGADLELTTAEEPALVVHLHGPNGPVVLR